jgi:hypothetical protein
MSVSLDQSAKLAPLIIHMCMRLYVNRASHLPDTACHEVNIVSGRG